MSRLVLVTMSVLVLAAALVATAAVMDEPKTPAPKLYAQWRQGLPAKADYFPIAVWLQDPADAAKYKALGINLYIGLWKGPTEKQLDELRKNGMPVICSMNDVALKHLRDPIIVAWMHGDEPDNAQSMSGYWKNNNEAANKAWPDVAPRKNWGTYGPPIPPKVIVASYRQIKSHDPTRPVMLNLGQGVAWKGYVGRGVRSGHLEDYPQYIKGCDIVSFDIYPAVHDKPQIKGKLEYVAQGVDRLNEWTGPRQLAWNCIEASRISNVNTKPTPEQIRSEVWMSIIHGSSGLIYFVHQFKPTFNGNSLLDDPELAAGVKKVNTEVHQLAAVINAPTVTEGVTVESSEADVPVDITVKRHGGATYVFAVAMRGKPTKATIAIDGLEGAKVQVLGEDRTLDAPAGKFTDDFTGYGVHLYRITK